MYQALNSIIKSLNKNQVTAALCLDLTKAFDSVNHNILLEKMEKYGIREVALDLFRSYLTRRTQRTTERGRNGKQTVTECKDQLECDLENLKKWFKRNELVINIDKTKLLVFRERNKEAISLTYHG
ncbi:uncharacterized protein LOC123308054 [Coccinella septempunctata]|uniref:uncharacterized protein LOC123308054 n=1 Tax=Coccinella septempunctata TaxID=41139 RepID=UPI001D070B2D|nr:uncharacterized protein LOC123308054 [Coccinella septempunctata]